MPLVQRVEQGFQQLFHQDRQPLAVGFRIVQENRRGHGLGRHLRVERAPEIARGQPVKPVGFPAETRADLGRGQVQEAAQGVDAEPGQEVADFGSEIEALQRHAADMVVLFLGRVEDHHDPVTGLGRGIAAETGEPHGHGVVEVGAGEVAVDEAGPFLQAGMEQGKPRGPEPEHPGLVPGGLHLRGKTPQSWNQRVHGFFDGRMGNDPRPEMARKRQPRAMAHAREDTQGPRPAVHPEDGSLGLVLVHHRGGMVLPVRMVPQQQLQGKSCNVNTGHPLHGTTPCGSIPEHPACP